jgi:hypothetical protein
MTIYEQLLSAAKVELKAGEAFPAFAKRAALRVNKLEDVDWKVLSEDLQEWTNGVMKALDAKTEIPALEGFPEQDEASEETTTEDEASDGDEVAPDGAEAAEEASEAPARAKPKVGKKAAPAGSKKAVAPAKAKGAKPAAKAKNGAGKGRGRPSGFAEDAKIKLLVKENPHRKTSGDFKKFAKLASGVAVSSVIAKGVDLAYLRYAQQRELLKIVD